MPLLRPSTFLDVLVLVLVIVLGIVLARLEATVRDIGRPYVMPFDHEKLDVYRLAIEFIAWVGDRLDTSLQKSGMSATKHLDEASQAIANDIAEGNGRRSAADRCRFLDVARGSALECAACLDALAARRRITKGELAEGKLLLERIVMMLWRMIEAFQTSSPSTSTRPSRPVRRSRSVIQTKASSGRADLRTS